MALPQGFDPRKMTFGGTSAPRISIPRNDAASYRRRASLWSRYNHGVANVGNWFADHVENVTDVFNAILLLGYVVCLIWVLVTEWMEKGFWTALLDTVLAGGLGYLLLGVVLVILEYVISIVMYVFRLLFWNGWTLLLAFAMVAFYFYLAAA